MLEEYTVSTFEVLSNLLEAALEAPPEASLEVRAKSAKDRGFNKTQFFISGWVTHSPCQKQKIAGSLIHNP